MLVPIHLSLSLFFLLVLPVTHTPSLFLSERNPLLWKSYEGGDPGAGGEEGMASSPATYR